MGFKTRKTKYFIVKEDLASDDLVNKRVKTEITEDEYKIIKRIIDKNEL